MPVKSMLASAAIGIALALTASVAANATTYDFSYVDGSDHASGQFSTSGANVVSGFGKFVTAGAGTINASIQPGSGSDGAFVWDNLFPVDIDGLLFQDVTNTFEINIWSNGTPAGIGSTPNSSMYVASPPGTQPFLVADDGGTLTIALPEAATWALMLLGVAGVGAGLRMSRDRFAATAL
jgi:hypothetical protein